MWRIMARQEKIRTDGTSGGDDHFLLQIDKRISNALQNIQSTISSKVQKHMANELKKIVKTERKLEHPDVKDIMRKATATVANNLKESLEEERVNNEKAVAIMKGKFNLSMKEALKKVRKQYTNHLSEIESEMRDLKKNIELMKTRSQQVEHFNHHASDDISVDTSPNSKGKRTINAVVVDTVYIHAINNEKKKKFKKISYSF